MLLIMGGSLGAKAINDIIDHDIQAFTQDFQIVHLRGRGNLNPSLNRINGYCQFEYVNEQLADIFAATDIVLSRAGANAIFEFVALGLPSLLIPLPLSASRGDQLENAEYFQQHGYSLVLHQEELTDARLRDALHKLVLQKDAMRSNITQGNETNGTQNVLDVIYECIRQ